MKRCVYILFFMLLAFTTSAQQVLKVVTRVVDEEYRYPNEFLLEINAEKANIDIKVVEGNTVKLVLEQSAKNEDVRIAEKELSFIHFVAKKDKNRLYLNNYAQLQADAKGLSSIINNNYTIEVPRHCHVKIKNELGSVTVEGLRSSMRFNLSYCSLTMIKSDGKMFVDSRIGDVTLQNCIAEAEFMIDNVNLKMQNCAGSYDIQAQFGSVSCLMSENIPLFKAEVEQCDVTLINRTSLDFDYALTAEKAKIVALDEVLGEMIVVEDNTMTLMKKCDPSVGTVIIDSEYGDINLY